MVENLQINTLMQVYGNVYACVTDQIVKSCQ